MKEAIPCLVFLTTLFNIMMPGLLALKDVEIILPRYVRLGLDVQLSCNYDLEKEALYAVKWYKGTQEFYRYLPKEVPPAKAFLLPGLYVDVTLSNDHDVLLRNVPLEVSGVYKCVVAAEFPFQTLSAASEMMVVVIGDDGPRLELDRSQYHPGDPISAKCTAPSSYPPANITWYINDSKEDQERISKTDVRKDKDDPVAKSALSSISFDLPEKVTPVRIKCRATVFTAYDQNSTITTINPVPRQLTGTETLLRPGSSVSALRMTISHLSLGMILLVWFSK